METLNQCLDVSQIHCTTGKWEILCSRAEAENLLEKQFRPRGNLESEKRQALNHYQISDSFFSM